jgi:hypothetical protein
MTDDALIISKIRKCLALAQSANEFEAAAALRQAQKLMLAHGISDADVEFADIQEAATRAGAFRSPARWEADLACIIAQAFACATYFRCSNRKGSWVFVGVSPSGEIACYAFRVLSRQVRKARARYMHVVLKRYKAPKRTRLADVFCEYWVAGATKLVKDFVGDDATRARVTAYIKTQTFDQKLKTTDRSADGKFSGADMAAGLAGSIAGRKAQLNRGVGSETRPALAGINP